MIAQLNILAEFDSRINGLLEPGEVHSYGANISKIIDI